MTRDTLPWLHPSSTKNIASHGNDSPEATVFGLYHATEWLQGAKADFDQAQQARTGITSESAASAVVDAAHRVNTLLAWRDAAKLKALADEELSFELELGSNPKPAREYRAELRSQFPGADLSKREVRVLSWLRDNKKLILDAEHEFLVDRLAIAAPIAWEAMHNIMSGGLRGVGPGKMHTYSNKWAGSLPLSKDDAVLQQLEQQGTSRSLRMTKIASPRSSPRLGRSPTSGRRCRLRSASPASTAMTSRTTSSHSRRSTRATT